MHVGGWITTVGRAAGVLEPEVAVQARNVWCAHGSHVGIEILARTQSHCSRLVMVAGDAKDGRTKAAQQLARAVVVVRLGVLGEVARNQDEFHLRHGIDFGECRLEQLDTLGIHRRFVRDRWTAPACLRIRNRDMRVGNQCKRRHGFSVPGADG